MPTYGSLWPRYAKRWDQMHVTRPALKTMAQHLVNLKSRYLAAEAKTKVPWYMIALLHMRESDNNFNTQLAQGDPLHSVSHHVPSGRGPFNTWEAGAYDALITLKHWDRVSDWRLEKILYYSELYNGWGYYNHGVPSAYVWAGSNIYRGGKYIADGVWSSSAVDSQPGIAPVLKLMMEIDHTIKPKRETDDVKPSGAAMGTVVAGGAAAVATSGTPWWPYVLGASAALAVAFALILYFKRKRDAAIPQATVVVDSPPVSQPGSILDKDSTGSKD